jgi:hypothetical protein
LFVREVSVRLNRRQPTRSAAQNVGRQARTGADLENVVTEVDPVEVPTG